MNFIIKSKQVHGDLFDYSKAQYKNIDAKVEIRCIKHNEIFQQSPYNHMNGRIGCLQCINDAKSARYIWDTADFIKNANRVHGSRYDYSKVEYKNSKSPVCVICSIHGAFYVSPANHIHLKHNCYHCSVITRGLKRRKTQEKFISEAREIHGEKYDYSKTIYFNQCTKVVVSCPKHGEFMCSPADHIHSQSGCPQCRASRGEVQVRNFLTRHKIKFTEQYRFKDCRNKLPLPFDFFLPEMNLCIEYDGIHHYQPVPRGQAQVLTPEMLKYTKNNDDIKNRFCEEKGIRLIRIPFWEAENIETVLKFQLGIE